MNIGGFMSKANFDMAAKREEALKADPLGILLQRGEVRKEELHAVFGQPKIDAPRLNRFGYASHPSDSDSYTFTITEPAPYFRLVCGACSGVRWLVSQPSALKGHYCYSCEGEGGWTQTSEKTAECTACGKQWTACRDCKGTGSPSKSRAEEIQQKVDAIKAKEKRK